MTSQKENLLNRTSASENPPRRFELQNRNRFGSATNLNQTFANIGNITSHGLPPAPIQGTGAIDNDLLYDLAYSDYLNAFSYNQYISNQKGKYRTNLSDQLSIYTDILSKKTQEVNNVEEKVKQHETRNNIQELITNLEEYLNDKMEQFPSEFEQQLTNITEMFEHAYNHLYLKNVEKLHTQEEYDQLLELVSKCDRILKNILSVVDNSEKYQELCDCLKQFKNAEQEIVKSEELLDTVEEIGTTQTLETVLEILLQYNNRRK